MQNKVEGNLKIIAKSAIILLGGIIISKLLIYVYRILIARYFNPEVYGMFSIALMISGWFVVFSALGLGEGALRYISYYRGKEDYKRIKEVFVTSMKIVVPLSIISGTIMFFLSGFFAVDVFHNEGLKIYLQLFSITVPLFAISQVLFGVIKAFEKISWFSTITNILQPLTRVVVLVFLLLIGLRSSAIIASLIAGFLVAFIVSYWVCRAYLFDLFLKVKVNRSKITNELLNYSVPLMFSSVVMSVLGWADTFLLGYLKNVEQVGIYNVALPIAMLLSFVPLLFTQLFFPIINKEFSKKNLDLIKELSKQISKWIFIINLPFLIVAVLFPGAIINILFGAQYLSGSVALIFLAVGFFFSAQSELPQNLLGMIKKSKIRLLDIALALFIDIILCLILIPKHGLAGAAFATMVSYIFYSIIIFAQTYYYLKILPVRRKMLTILISGIISGIFLLIIRSLIEVNIFTLAIAGFFFILFYIFLILITKSLDRNDIMIFKTTWSKITSWKRNK